MAADSTDLCFEPDEQRQLHAMVDRVLDRGVAEMQIANDFGVMLARRTQETGRAPSPEELHELAKMEFARVLRMARHADLTTTELAEAIQAAAKAKREDP